MPNTRTAALLVIGLTLGLAPIVDAATRICAEQEAISAEMEADSLKTWAQVFAAYKQYRQCDDGGIAEGYSDSIATLLAERWDQLKTLMTDSDRSKIRDLRVASRGRHDVAGTEQDNRGKCSSKMSEGSESALCSYPTGTGRRTLGGGGLKPSLSVTGNIQRQ